jgi:hypothetical protein
MNKTHTISNESHDASPEEATQVFIARTEELLALLKDGRHKLDHAVLSAMVIALPEEIDAVPDPTLRAQLQAHPQQSGIGTTIGAGDSDRIMEMISRLPELFAEGLIKEHHKECDDADCMLNDPNVAPYVGTLKAMAMTYARATSSIEAVQLLSKSLKDMGRKALRAAEVRAAQQEILKDLGSEDLNDAQVMALGGDKALKFMQLLAESGLLPEEASEKIKADMAKHEGHTSTGMDVEEHTSGRNVTVVKNGPSTKQ